MKNREIKEYTDSHRKFWKQMSQAAKNGTFPMEKTILKQMNEQPPQDPFTGVSYLCLCAEKTAAENLPETEPETDDKKNEERYPFCRYCPLHFSSSTQYNLNPPCRQPDSPYQRYIELKNKFLTDRYDMENQQNRYYMENLCRKIAFLERSAT